MSILRILIAPLFAIFFLLSGVISPNRRARIGLIIAGGVEVSVFGFATIKLLFLYNS